MPDVSIELNPVSSSLTPDPIYKLKADAVNKCVAAYGKKVKNDYKLAAKAVYESDTLNEEVTQVVKMYGYERVEPFKKNIMGMLVCMSKVIQLHGIDGVSFITRSCNQKGCEPCTPYRACKMVRYHDVMIRVAETDDYELGYAYTHEIKEFFEDQEKPYMVVNMTSSHDGRHFIRIGCLRYNEATNPMLDDNEVKEFISLFDWAHPEFEKVNKVSGEAIDQVSVYITEINKIKISTTDLYMTKPEGQGGQGSKEAGTKKGFEYSENQVIHMTDEERKKKQEEENGIVATVNAPVIPIDRGEEEVFEAAYIKAIKEVTAFNGVMVIQGDDVDALKHAQVTIARLTLDNLADAGLNKPLLFSPTRYKQEEIDRQLNLYGLPYSVIPDNIMEMVFEDDDISFDGRRVGLRERARIIKNRVIYEVQRKIKQATNIDDFADMMREKVRKLI